MLDPLDAVDADQEEARAKIEATREVLQAVNDPKVREVLARLDRIVEELERIGEKDGDQAVMAE